jgi:putative transposase
MSATISRVADRWFVSITMDTPDTSHLPQAENEPSDENQGEFRRSQNQVQGEFWRSQNQGAVGVDLGVSALATLSTGEKIAGPKAHTALLARLRRLSRSAA